MKILIISGFLGAGKTTFIKAMTKATGRSFVIYENEYGASSVDTKILENENLSVWESTENCVCCTGKGDFTQSLITISATLDPDYLVVEPTGVASLSSIEENIKQIQYERISLLPPVAIADCANWQQQVKTAEDLWKDQISNASTVVFSKIEKGLETREDLKRLVRDINPDARLVEEDFNKLEAAFFNEILEKSNSNKINGVTASEKSSLVQLTVENAKLPTLAHLAYILDLAVMGAFGKVSRAKGFLKLQGADGWVKFDLVEREWAITGMEESNEDTRPVAVFIGEALQKPVLLELFNETYVSSDIKERTRTAMKMSNITNQW